MTDTNYDEIIQKLSKKYSMSANNLVSTLCQTAFKQTEENVKVGKEELFSLLAVMDAYNLNPFTKELWAYFDKKKGLVLPVVSIDGWIRIINEHPQFNGLSFNESEQLTNIQKSKKCPEWMEVTIYRRDRDHPTVIREYFEEVYRNFYDQSPWNTVTKRMMRHKTMIQGSRVAFGFAGIYDQDEAEKILTESSPTHKPAITQPKAKTPEQDASENNEENVDENEKQTIEEPKKKTETKKTEKSDKTEPEKKKKGDPVNESMLKVINIKIKQKQVPVESVLTQYDVSKLEDLPKSIINDVITFIDTYESAKTE